MSTDTLPTNIRKRDGRLEPFERAKITHALAGALREVGKYSEPLARDLTDKVLTSLSGRAGDVTVENIQDLVESTLIRAGLPEVAKAYQQHILAGIKWALGLEKMNAKPQKTAVE